MFKRKLDLNGPAYRIIAIAGLFGVILPAFLYGASFLIKPYGSYASWIYTGMKISLGLGIVMLVLLVSLVIIEQMQDSLYDAAYRKQRRKKLALQDGGFECQFCGCQKVGAQDRQCPACGEELEG